MIFADICFRSLLDKGERIVTVAHVHPFKIYPKLFSVLFFGVMIPLGAYFLFPPFWTIWAGWVGVGILLFAYRILQWYLDAWIVTNFAVIKQEWRSFFDKQANRIEYGNIEGMTFEIKGFWGTVLRFGNIQIDHMSGNQLILLNVASPRRIERIIMEHQQNYLERQNFDDHSKLKELLTKLLRNTNKSG